MNNIFVCIDSINAIDDSIFLAECDVMMANSNWLSKTSDMIKYSDNRNSIITYIQEADYGRRDTGGNKWLNKIRMFVLKCIDKIIDAITNFLLKIKTRNAEYIRIPYKYEDLMEDINFVKEVDRELYQIFDNVEKFASVDSMQKLTKIKEKLRETHFAKNKRIMISDKDPEAHNKTNKYGIKPDKYIQLAKELRDLSRALKDTKARASKMVQKEWLKDIDTADKTRVAVQELLFNIYNEMSVMVVKLMQSFTISSVEKMDQAVVEKKIKTAEDGIIKLRRIIGEAVEHDIDNELEYFDETEKPFDEFLNKHKYDSKTNTIEVDGRRFNAGKIPSKKERNRMNRFLRENNYDPKTETYESDIKDKNGKNERIKLNIVSPSIKHDNAYHLGITFGKKGFDDSINISTNTLKEKPHASNSSLKHEEGHAAQSRGKHSTDFEGAKKLVDENDLPENKHYSANESDADLYGYEHNPYANKNRKNKTSLSVDSKETRKLEKRDKKDIKKIIDDVDEQEYRKRNTEMTSFHVNNLLRENLHLTKKTIEDIDVAISDAIKLIDEEPIPGDFEIPKTSLIEGVEKLKKRKKDVERNISTIEEKIQKVQKGDLNFKLDDDDKRTINQQIEKDVKDYISLAENQIKRIKTFRDSYKKELQLRNDFLDQHAEVGGSQARKLEGRQGKHKGKK